MKIGDQDNQADAAEPPPGCVLLLLRLSADMSAEIDTTRGESTAIASARYLADELLEALVQAHDSSAAPGMLDVAVLGYREGEDGSPQLLSLLPDDEPQPCFLPLWKIAAMHVESRTGEDLPRKWLNRLDCEGKPNAAIALAEVYRMIAIWLTGRYQSRPPVVIHCTGGDGLDEPYLQVARSLQLLTTRHGPVRLLHYLFDCQSGQLAHALTSSTSWLNYWDLRDPLSAIFDFSEKEDGVAWKNASECFTCIRSMWAQKKGNAPEEWEDAFAVAESGNAAAIADGASTGIYCRVWAEQLCQRFLSDQPDMCDASILFGWVNHLRAEWRAAIDYDNLSWSKQAKVDQVGAAATLLGLEFGPAESSGNRAWRAFAVGDSCLFWLRDGKLLASFPIVADNQFGSAPLLIRSNPGFRTSVLISEGECEPDDRFLLATDAIAARLLKSMAWDRLETIDQDEWQAELDTLRRDNEMVNDDCTLLILRVNE